MQMLPHHMLTRRFRALKSFKALAGLCLLAGLPSLSQAQSTWNGSTSGDWNTAANWSAGVPSGVNAVVPTNGPNIATITSTLTATPVDIAVGTVTGTTGQVNHISGDAFTGNGSYMYLSYVGATGIYNLADTTKTGGPFTGYGMGSGNLYVGGNSTTSGNLLMSLDPGSVSIFNMNSSGILSLAGNLYASAGGNGGGPATFNLDHGTVVVTNDADFGASFWGSGAVGSGTLNMSGGSLTAHIIGFAIGGNNAATVTGTGNITGGTLNSREWFTLGFAGNNNLGAVTNDGGTINVKTAGPNGNLELTVWDTSQASFTLKSGAVNLFNNASIVFGAQGNSGSGTFNQEGGTVTFYSDAGTTVGGTGSVDLRGGGGTGTYVYNLDGGVLTVPSITKSGSSGSGTFNFNGGTVKPTGSSATFMQGLTSATVRGGGALFDTAGHDITLVQPLADGGENGGLTKLGNGTLTLAAGYGYTGPTFVLGGGLALDAAQQSNYGHLSVSNAALNISLNNGSSTIYANNLTLTGSNTWNLAYGTIPSTLPTPATAIYALGTVTVSGATTINISGIGLGVGVVPLVTSSGTVDKSNFKLGTLPTGMMAVLTNATANSLDLLVTAAGQNLVWYGADNSGTVSLPTWDINASQNWNSGNAKYLQYSGNSYGDNVTFDDSLSYSPQQATNVTLNARVVPNTLTFGSAYTPYNLTGSGGIDGAVTLLKTNAGSLLLGTSNNYSGGTIIAGGWLAIQQDNALGTGPVTLAGGTLQLNGAVSSPRSITLTANSGIGVAAGATAQWNGNLTGTGALTKSDAGTLTLGGSNSYAGATAVSAGRLSLTGSATTKSMTVGNGAGAAVLDIAGSLTTSNLFVGNADGSFGVVHQTGGTVTLAGGTGDVLNVGNVTGSYGYYDAAGGTLNVNGISVGGENNPNVWPPSGAGDGLMEVHGATINNIGWIVLARGGMAETGVLNVYSGSLSYAGGGIGCNWEQTGSDQTSIINLLGGSVTSATQGVNFRTANTGILNLNGGVLQGTSVTGAGILNFNGGTLQAPTNIPNFVAVTRANVYSGGAIINDGGYTVTVNQPLVAPEGYGVSTISLTDGGSGYIAPPIVTLSGGLGSNATAVATIAGGRVTALAVTSPGTGYGASDVLFATFTGGGANVVQPTVGTIALAANASGGLTKTGTGTLNLAGANAYTGTTTVATGKLYVTPNHQMAAPVAVADGASFGVATGATNTSATIGDLTVGNTSGATVDLAYSQMGNPTNIALSAGTVTVKGTSYIRIGGAFSVGTFPVLKYGSLNGSFAGVLAPRGTTATLSNDTAHATLYVVISGVGGGIVWTGTDTVKTNVWDLNTTTNWLSGGTPTTYQEMVPPGDAVLFNDLGSGTVLLSNTASPLSVTISNQTQAYVFAGTGKLSGIASLTKTGAATATLRLANDDYTGPTTIAAGNLVVASGSAVGDLSAVTLSNVAGATLTVSNAEVIGSLAGGGPLGGNVALSGGDLTAGGNNQNTTFSGAATGTSRFIMKGSGTLTLKGQINTGNELWVGQDSGNAPVLNVESGASVTSSNWFCVGRNAATGTINVNGGSLVHAGTGNITLGTLGTNPQGTINLNSGSITNLVGETYLGEGSSAGDWGYYNQAGGSASLGNLYVGHNQGNGHATITGGALSAGNLRIACGDNNTRVGTNVLTLAAGSTVTSSGYVELAYAGSASKWGMLTNDGGTLNVGATRLTLCYWDPCSAMVTLNSGAINLWNNADITYGQGNNNSGTGTFNQNDGTVTFYSDAGTTVGGTGRLRVGAYGGGTYVYNLNGGTLAVSSIIRATGSGTFNFNGGTLKAVVNHTNFISALTGANVRDGGAVIDTAGFDVTVPQVLQHSSLDGDAATDGGLTKNGSGTLTLNGTNTYNGQTTVNGGALGGTGTIAGALVVNSGAALAPGSAGIGTLTVNGNLTLNSGSASTFEVNGSTGTNDLVVAGGTVTYGGVLNIVPSGTFTAGQQFTLFSGAGAANGGNFASIVGSPGNGLAFSFANGVLSVVTGQSYASYPTNIVCVRSGSSLSLSWPATHLGWLAQSNSVNVADTNFWFSIPGSDLTTNLNITIDPAQPKVFYRLRKP